LGSLAACSCKFPRGLARFALNTIIGINAAANAAAAAAHHPQALVLLASAAATTTTTNAGLRAIATNKPVLQQTKEREREEDHGHMSLQLL
jgi:hypothetical protein